MFTFATTSLYTCVYIDMQAIAASEYGGFPRAMDGFYRTSMELGALTIQSGFQISPTEAGLFLSTQLQSQQLLALQPHQNPVNHLDDSGPSIRAAIGVQKQLGNRIACFTMCTTPNRVNEENSATQARLIRLRINW